MSQESTVSIGDADFGDHTSKHTHRLLIVGCSHRKRPNPAPTPAIERYDGPLYQVIRKFRRSDQDSSSLDIYILSARHGLISSYRPIPLYDQRMTLERANELAPHTLLKFVDLLTKENYRYVHLSLGINYMRCLPGYESVLPQDTEVTISKGSMGERQYLLKHWLYQRNQPECNETTIDSSSIQGSAIIRGVKVSLSPNEIISLARTSLESNLGSPENFRTWYVDLDGKRVAPKWLVSQLIGLEVKSFHSGEARRFLNNLGIRVRSI